MINDGLWLSTGMCEGKLVRSSGQRLSSIESAISISIDVLEAVVNDDHLESSLVFRELFSDIKLARFGYDWAMEREAVAAQTVSDFRLAWPSMREHMLRNQLVALVSSLENYVMSLLVEFPPSANRHFSERASSDKEFESNWQGADSAYKKAVKAKQSASAAWVEICNQSSIPEDVKIAVGKWGNDERCTGAVDEMVLVRNSIVHRAGVIGIRLASHRSPIKYSLGKTVTVSQKDLKRFCLAYQEFVLIIEPAL